MVLPIFYSHAVVYQFQKQAGWIRPRYKNIQPIRTFALVTHHFSTGAPGKLYFRPGLDRQRPHHLEVRLTLPANSVTQIESEFQKGFLKWTEYPPDAHRGFDLGPAVISPVARNWTGPPRHVSTFDERYCHIPVIHL